METSKLKEFAEFAISLVMLHATFYARPYIQSIKSPWALRYFLCAIYARSMRSLRAVYARYAINKFKACGHYRTSYVQFTRGLRAVAHSYAWFYARYSKARALASSYLTQPARNDSWLPG